MSNLIKQVIGIDCSCETLDCAYGSLDANANQQIQSSTQFKNDTSGFKKLLAWTAKRAASGVPLRFIVEATGVYHERLADFLVASDCEVSVVVPNRISNFFRTTGIKTINDAAAAKMIAMYGLEKSVTLWQQPNPVFNSMKQLTRERQQ